MIAFGGVMVAIAWTLNSVADLLPMLYLGAILSGIGAGAVYGTCVGNALKWFPDRRGLAAGLTAAGFGAGAALTVYPIITTIQTHGYQAAFLWFGLGQGIIVMFLAVFLRAPKGGQVPTGAQRISQAHRDHTPAEMLKSPIFYLLYIMFVMVAASGLVVTAQIAPIARDYKIAGVHVDLFFIAGTTLVVAGIVDNVLNGLARPTFGWISDHIGRENTMAIVFAFGAAAYWGLGTLGTSPVGFVIAAGLVYLHLGRDLQPLPRDLYRHVRLEIRHDQCRAALHGERHGSVPGAGGELAASCDGKLARGLRGRDHRQSAGRGARALCVEAVARRL